MKAIEKDWREKLQAGFRKDVAFLRDSAGTIYARGRNGQMVNTGQMKPR